MSKTIRTAESVIIPSLSRILPLIVLPSLYTCMDEQSTDEDTSDENAAILDEMSQTLENLLRENPTTFTPHEVGPFLTNHANSPFDF